MNRFPKWVSLTICFLLMISFTLELQAALSDAAALKKAVTTFGIQARIGTVRNRTASNWTKQVGIETIGCDHDFTVLGEGFNTWDAAFADYDAKIAAGTPPIKNVFNGMTTITPLVVPGAFTNGTSTVFVKVILDGTAYGPELTITDGIVAPLNFDATTVTKGAHAFCFQIRDDAGRTGLSPAWMFFRN